MSELRSLNGQDVPSVIDFLNEHLRPSVNWSIADEYPTTFSTNNLRNLHIICDNDKVLSHAAMRYLIVKSPQAIFKVAAIGSVVTSSEHRKQGLSRKILLQCISSAAQESSDIAVLWTNLFDFYRKLDFELAGQEVGILIDSEFECDSSDLKFREGSNISAESLLRIYTKHSVNSVRTLEEIRQYLKIPNSRVYTAWNRQGLMQAYAVEGKGADLKGYIHEWGGGVSHLMALFSHIRREQKKNITVISPSHSTHLIQRFEKLGFSVHRGFLGMIRILNPKSVSDKVTRHARSLGISEFSMRFEENKYILKICKHAFTIEDPRKIVQLLFGPHNKDFFKKESPEIKSIYNQVFPMNLWFWGWDSI